MKLAAPALVTTALAFQAPQLTSRSQGGHPAQNSALFNIQPAPSKQTTSITFHDHLRSPLLSEARPSLTALRAAENDDHSADKPKNDTTPEINDFLVVDEIIDLMNKYKEIMTKDGEDLMDEQLNLWLARASEIIEKFNEKHPKVVDGISDLVDEIDEAQTRLEQIKSWLKESADSAPDFLKSNTTDTLIDKLTDGVSTINNRTNSFLHGIFDLFTHGDTKNSTKSDS